MLSNMVLSSVNFSNLKYYIEFEFAPCLDSNTLFAILSSLTATYNNNECICLSASNFFTHSSKPLCSLVQHCCEGFHWHSWSCCLHSFKGKEQILVEKCLCLHGSGPVTTPYKVTDFWSPLLIVRLAPEREHYNGLRAHERQITNKELK